MAGNGPVSDLGRTLGDHDHAVFHTLQGGRRDFASCTPSSRVATRFSPTRRVADEAIRLLAQVPHDTAATGPVAAGCTPEDQVRCQKIEFLTMPRGDGVRLVAEAVR
jgi:hypothetical protein